MLNEKPVVDAAGGDHAMRKNIAIEDEVPLLGADWWPSGAPAARHVRADDGVGAPGAGDRQRWQASGVAVVQ